MSEASDESNLNAGNALPAVPGGIRLPAEALFASVAEAPYKERPLLYREARDAVYLNFADNVLAMPDERTLEERVAALEFVGSALAAFLPEAFQGYYYFGHEPSQINHALNSALLALRLDQIRTRGYHLASQARNHLDEAFPPKPLGKTENKPWQWGSGEIYRAKNTCLFFMHPEGLGEDSLGLVVADKITPKLTEADLLRAAQVYTEVSMWALPKSVTKSDEAINQEVAALAALRNPNSARQITDETMLAELNRLEIQLRAMAIVRIGMPKYGKPINLIQHGEFIFDPANCDEQGIPHGLSAEEADKVREAHIKNLHYMAEYASDPDSRPAYAELLAKYQPPSETPATPGV